MIRYQGRERRAGKERRLASTTRWVLPIREWLAFDSPVEKRRLIPVPDNWEQLPDRELERLCDQAIPVRKVLAD